VIGINVDPPPMRVVFGAVESIYACGDCITVAGVASGECAVSKSVNVGEA